MKKEQFILGGVIGTSNKWNAAESSISDLYELLKLTGGDVVSSFVINKMSFGPAHIIGSGWL